LLRYLYKSIEAANTAELEEEIPTNLSKPAFAKAMAGAVDLPGFARYSIRP